MSSFVITVQTPKDTSEMVVSGQSRENIKRALNVLNGIQAGKLPGKIELSASTSNPVAASGTITLVSAVATNSVTIGKTVFTFTSTPSTSTDTAQDVEVDGGDDSTDAAALAAAINANSASSAIVYATSALGVVTVTCRVPGILGNQIALAKSGAPITVSGTYLSGGTGGSGSLGTTLTQLSRV
jgi:phage tail sheath gpL-like